MSSVMELVVFAERTSILFSGRESVDEMSLTW